MCDVRSHSGSCALLSLYFLFSSPQSTYWLTFELMWRDYFRFYSAKHGDALFHKDGVQPRANYKWKVRCCCDISIIVFH
jgi:deoxyribodipyrimidine photolyase